MSPASPYGSPSLAATQGTHCWFYGSLTNVWRIEQLALKEESTSDVESQSIRASAKSNQEYLMMFYFPAQSACFVASIV